MPTNRFNFVNTNHGQWLDTPCEDCDGAEQRTQTILDNDLNEQRYWWFEDKYDALCAKCRVDWERMKRTEHIYTDRYLQRLDEEQA